MKKLYITLGVVLSLLMFSSVTFGQLSDRVSSPSTFKIGTRPVSGDMGVYFGIAYKDIKNLIDNKDYEGLPLVSIKYYISDNLVGRIGIDYSKETDIEKGEIDPVITGGTMIENTSKQITSDLLLTPGVERHFLNSNLFDAYFAAMLPLGYKRDIIENDQVFQGNLYDEYKMSRFSFAYGLECLVGIQGFIADLPLALGLEIGFSGLGYISDKYKSVVNSNITGTVVTQTYYTRTDDPVTNGDIYYSKLSARNYEMSGNVRIQLSYYFSK